MSAQAISAIYTGTVRHARYTPARHRFSYRVFSLYLDVDDLDARTNLPALLSVDRFNLFSIRLKDHGPKDATGLRRFIDNLLAKRGLAAPEKIFILCYPRILGYAFNPLTVYYCLNDGAVSALVYEVRNTFGDDHIYVVPVGARGNETSLSHAREKQMHVSPFIDCTPHIIFLRRCRMTICALLFEKLKTTPPFSSQVLPAIGARLQAANCCALFLPIR